MKKVDYVHGSFVLATTSSDGFCYDDFREWWEDCYDGEDIPGDNSKEFYSWCREEAESNWENDLDNIKSWKDGDIPVIITGGFTSHPQYMCYYGSSPRRIVPLYCGNLKEAVQRCLNQGGYHEVTIKYSDGEILFTGYDHDGNYTFHINALSSKGYDKVTRAMDAGRDIPELTRQDVKRFKYMYA